LKADDYGSWKNNGVRATIVSIASGEVVAITKKEAKSRR